MIVSAITYVLKGWSDWERNFSHWKRINYRFPSSSQQCHLYQYVNQCMIKFDLKLEILEFRELDFEGLGNVVVEFSVFDGKFSATETVLYVVKNHIHY